MDPVAPAMPSLPEMEVDLELQPEGGKDPYECQLQQEKAKKVLSAQSLLEKAKNDKKVYKPAVQKRGRGRGRGKGRGRGAVAPAEEQAAEAAAPAVVAETSAAEAAAEAAAPAKEAAAPAAVPETSAAEAAAPAADAATPAAVAETSAAEAAAPADGEPADGAPKAKAKSRPALSPEQLKQLWPEKDMFGQKNLIGIDPCISTIQEQQLRSAKIEIPEDFDPSAKKSWTLGSPVDGSSSIGVLLLGYDLGLHATDINIIVDIVVSLSCDPDQTRTPFIAHRPAMI